MNQTDLTAAANRARGLRRKANLALAESEALLAERLKELVEHLKTGEPTAQQLALLPLIIDAVMKLRDRALADLWSVRLADAIRLNPKLANEIKNMPSLNKVAGGAARVLKAGSEDARTQSERRRLKTARDRWERDQAAKSGTPSGKRKADDLLSGLGDS